MAAHVFAAPLAVTNPGFEEPYLGGNLPPEYNGEVPGGAFPVGPAPAGWSIYDPGGIVNTSAFVGVLDPNGSTFFPATPEGTNAALLYTEGATGGSEYGIDQTLAATLQANTVYTLTVEVGNIASGTGLVAPFNGFGFYNLDGFPGYRVQLLAGAVVVAEDDGALSATLGEGTFAPSTVQLTTGASPGQLGQPLAIRLVNRNQPDDPLARGLEVDFDDVRLDATPAAASVPLPAAAIGILALTLALTATIAARRRP